jgi:hypothetical protein
MGTPGVAAVTLTVHDRPRPGQRPIADADLPHFDVTLAGDVSPRPPEAQAGSGGGSNE